MSQSDGHHGAPQENSYGEYDRDKITGRIKEAVGVITDNDRLKSEGRQIRWWGR